MNYLYIKALHIIFMVTWFAGLFYMGRLLIYAREAADKPEAEKSILLSQLLIMQRRLWQIITWPGGILTTFFGVWMLVLNPGLLLHAWMLVKLFFVFILWLYHIYTGVMHSRQKRNLFHESSFRLRLWNEIPTLILLVVVFLAVVKSEHVIWKLLLSGIVLGLIMFFVVKWYKRHRESYSGKSEKRTQ